MSPTVDAGTVVVNPAAAAVVQVGGAQVAAVPTVFAAVALVGGEVVAVAV